MKEEETVDLENIDMKPTVIWVWLAALWAAIFCIGCASVSATYKPDGTLCVDRKNWIWSDVNINEFEAGADTNGIKYIKLKGYSTKSEENIQAIVDATAKLVEVVGKAAVAP